jgi:hypothetical protein
VTTSNQSQTDTNHDEGVAVMLRSAQVVSGMIFAYWIGFIGLIILGVFKSLPKFSMPDEVIFSLLVMHVGSFPIMLLCVVGVWKLRPRYAKCCLGITLLLALLTYLSIPTVVE